jgi:hypothetical protein
LYDTETGALIQRFPDLPPVDRRDFIPLFLKAKDSEVICSGVFTVTPAGDGPPVPWMRRIHLQHNDVQRRVPARKSRNSTVDSDEEMSPWMSSSEYGKWFAKMENQQMYRIMVEGQLRGSQSQYRASFVKRPTDLQFASLHGSTEADLKQRSLRWRMNGLTEIWRQSFVDNQGITRWSVIWTKSEGPHANAL